MAISEQKINSLYFETLKSIKDLTIDFSGSELTSIMGINGSGKSTVLHALACCYKPVDNDTSRENYKLSEFFTPNTDALWAGSKFTMIHSYRNGADTQENETEVYTKSDRWNPKYDRRPVRNVIFIGIKSCVPRIEEERKNTFIRYTTTALTDDVSRIIRDKCSYVMNRTYTSYNNHQASTFLYIGVEYNNNRYSSLSMGAGEQRLFTIISKVFMAPKYSLILIDEIDLLLHVNALHKLLSVLKVRASEKKLQIIFTTHAPSIMEMTDIVNIRHIWNTREKTLCFTDTKPDAIHRLTGEHIRPLEISVEDDLSQAIVKHSCESMLMHKYVSVIRFGAAANCFTLVSGLLLSGASIENSLFLLDGDVYYTADQKVAQINKTLTGDTQHYTNLRRIALASITQFNLPSGLKPEKFIHQLITSLPEEVASSSNEIKRAALEIHTVDNDHNYVDDIIERIGFDRNVGLYKIIELASKSAQWEAYVQPLKVWLQLKQPVVFEPAS